MPKIFDAHSHYMPPAVAEKTAFFKVGWSDIDRQLSVMDECGIEKALLLYPTSDAHLNMGGWQKVCEAYNTALADIVHAHPDRFIGAGILPADSPELWRRSIYRFIVRTTPQQFLATLDCADPANFTPKRNVTTTALQSLALFNNDFMLRQAGYLAKRLETEADSLDQQIDLAFQLLLGRPVTREERHVTEPLVREHGLMHLCRVLLNTNEFVYVD